MSTEDFETKLRQLYLESMKGDKAAYEIFLELSSVLIKRYLMKLGGKYADAQSIEDLLQEVLITLHEKKHTYQLDRPLLPWIYAISRHRYIDYYRSRKRRPDMVSIDAEFERELSIPETEPDHNIEEVMALLTPKQKEILMLIKVEGASYVEAAKTLSMSVPAVKVAVHRIVKALKGKVDHE
jgi:RNA polymerase sigma-70 factor (ECF subfamily)